ncbi:porin [Arcobacteraceae bacterium]|nr:porin [Arcobacteraceae bacterium]
MTKLIKMSLVAAVAVAGFSSTVAAKPLEESIQGVDFSGYLRYRYTNGESNDVDQNQYRIQATAKAKVNDTITAKFAIEGDTRSNDTVGDDDGTNGSAATIRELNFTAKLGDATVTVGKQGLVTPFADSGLDSQQGTGIVALYPVGPVTLAAGWYNNSDATAIGGTDISGSNISALAALGTAEMVNYSVWYANVSNQNTTQVDADAINVNLSAAFGPVNVELNYASIDYQVNDADVAKTEQTRLVASFDADIVTVTAGVIELGSEGGDTTLGDTDAQSNFVMEEFSASLLKDTTAFYLGLSAPVGPVTIGLEHGTTSDVDGTTPGNVKFSETKLSVAYPMSKNFKVSGWLTGTSGDGTYDKLGASRLELKYTF